MLKSKIMQAGAVAAMVLGSFTAVPAMARPGWDDGYNGGGYGRGGYYEGAYRGGYDNRGYDGYRGYNGDRGYRGDNRYRCRRSDGATGTIIGAIAGGLIGNSVAGRRGDRTAGTIIGGAVGAVAGRAIDKGNSGC